MLPMQPDMVLPADLTPLPFKPPTIVEYIFDMIFGTFELSM